MHVCEIQANRQNLAQCVVAVSEWCSSRRLQLNPDKTELIGFGSRTNIKRLQQEDTSLQIGSTVITPVHSVRNLGVYMESEMSTRVHVGKVASACFYHPGRLRQLRFILTQPMMQRLASTIILSRLDYCNTVLAGLLAIMLDPLQRVMNATV